MLVAIFVFVMGIARDCGRLPSVAHEGFSGGDTLDIALIYGPGSYYLYDDSLGGINKEIATFYSDDLSLPVKLWPVNDPSDGLKKLETGAFDIVASLPLDNNIKKKFPVSESIFLDRLVLVQLSDTLGESKSVLSSLDLNGKEVYVASGSSAVNRLQNLSQEIGGNIKIIEEPEMSDELLCISVAEGGIPLAVVNERVASEIIKDYPYLQYDNSVSFTQFQVWVFNPQDSLLSIKFNDWLNTFRDTDTYRQILNRY